MWHDKKFLWLLFSASFVGGLELFSILGMHLPAFIGRPFFFLFIILIGYQTLWHGFLALVTFNIQSINSLMLIAVIGAWYLEKYEEAAVVIALYTLAEKLEDIGIERSQSALNALLEKMPKCVYLKGNDTAVPVQNVKIGDHMIIKPGEMIALDGKVLTGSSFVDESPVTGEPIAQEKLIGDLLYAGTINRQGYLEAEVLKTVENTTFAKIQQLTSQAMEAKAPMQTFIEKFSRYYTPFVMALAALWVFVPTFLLGYPLDPWLARGLSLIVIACPCALVISTPVSIYSAMGNAFKQGVLIKGGKYLEAIGQIGAIALDKTRTLTYGKPTVSDIIPYGNETKENVLQCAAGIELFSEHPLAQSIVEAAKNENLSLHTATNFKSIIGKGVQADCLVCSDKHHCIGKLPFVLEEHPVPKIIIDEIELLLMEGKTTIVIATQSGIEGVIALTDVLRPESFKLVKGLKELNITPFLLTGDHFSPSRIVAEQLNIENVYAELLPADKANIILEMMQTYGKVAMVGDGINDAPALALSSVGISLNSLSSDTAIEAASIVILNDRLDVIPFLIKLGRETLKTIQLNISLALTIKALFILLSLAGLSNLALAIFADVGVTLLVILISLRLSKFENKFI